MPLSDALNVSQDVRMKGQKSTIHYWGSSGEAAEEGWKVTSSPQNTT